MKTDLHWGRVLAGGVLAEIALIVAIVPLGLRLGQTFLNYAALIGSFVMCFLAAVWVGRRIESRFILHGSLVGAIAAAFYIALTRGQHEPLPYVVAHVLKIGGGALGGFAVQRRRTASPADALNP